MQHVQAATERAGFETEGSRGSALAALEDAVERVQGHGRLAFQSDRDLKGGAGGAYRDGVREEADVRARGGRHGHRRRVERTGGLEVPAEPGDVVEQRGPG